MMPVQSINGTSAECPRAVGLKGHDVCCCDPHRAVSKESHYETHFLTPEFTDRRTTSLEATATVRTAAITFSLFFLCLVLVFNVSVMESLSSISWFSFFLLSYS